MKSNKFQVGDEVIAISSNHPKIVRGTTYTIQAILFCTDCGDQSVNVGFMEYGRVKCECGNRSSPTPMLWSGSFRFVKAQDVESEIEDAVAVEDYELAYILKEHTKK